MSEAVRAALAGSGQGQAEGSANPPSGATPPASSNEPAAGASSTPDASTEGSGATGASAEGTPSPGQAGPDAPAGATAAGIPAYVPNFKYKANREEKEIPEQLRAVIKDPDSEKFVRELVEKAEGMDSIKERFQEFRNSTKELHQNHNLLNEGLHELGTLVKKQDFGTFFETLGVPKEAVFNWVLQEAQYQQLPPEQKARIDAQRAAERRASELEHSHQSLQETLIAQANQARQLELQSALASADVSNFVTQFDERKGEAGAFMGEVIKLGQYVWHKEGRDLPVGEAIQQVMAHYGKFLGTPNQGAGSAANGQAGQLGQAPAPVKPTVAAASAAAKRDVPTIPNMQGGTTSPVKPAVKTLDDLKARAKEAAARSANA